MLNKYIGFDKNEVIDFLNRNSIKYRIAIENKVGYAGLATYEPARLNLEFENNKLKKFWKG